MGADWAFAACNFLETCRLQEFVAAEFMLHFKLESVNWNSIFVIIHSHTLNIFFLSSSLSLPLLVCVYLRLVKFSNFAFFLVIQINVLVARDLLQASPNFAPGFVVWMFSQNRNSQDFCIGFFLCICTLIMINRRAFLHHGVVEVCSWLKIFCS